jgi:hypothetical protein
MSDNAHLFSAETDETIYTPAGYWRPLVEELIRVLRLDGCFEHAFELERQAQSVSPSTHSSVEIKAVVAIQEYLPHIYNNPPRGLAPEKYKELRRLRHEVTRSVGFRRRQLQQELETTEKAVRNLAERLETSEAERATACNRIQDMAEPSDEGVAQLVTLDQIAAAVHRSKRTLEKYKTRERNPLPSPDVEGGGGKPDEWKWLTVRRWLEDEFKHDLPERFPSGRFHDARADRS